MKRLAVIFSLFALPASAQTYTQMQWGLDKTVSPYAFGANINGTWRNFGTVSSTGDWKLPIATLQATGTPSSANYLRGDGSWSTLPAGGSVTSVALSLPSFITVSGSPVTISGTLTGTLAAQTANTFFAAPNGSTGTPTFRAIVAADVPTLNQNTTGTASNVTGTVAIANGGTGGTTASAARTNLGLGTAATQNTGTSGATIPLLNAVNTWSAAQTIAAPVTINGGSTSMVDLYTSPPTSGSFLAQSNVFSFYPTIGNDPGDHQRAQQLVVFTPTQDATISETGITINANLNTGYASAWPGATTAVTLNKLIYDPTGFIWKATTAGTTGGTQPTWPTSVTLGVTTVSDGSVVWTAQAHNQANAKMPLFISATAGSGAGHVWAIDTAMVLQSGWAGGFANSAEFDFQNNSGADCLTCQTVFITGDAGANKIAAGLSIYNPSATNYAYADAIVLGGNKLASNSDIRSFSASPYFLYDAGSHTWGLELAGTYSSGAIRAYNAIRLNYDYARVDFYPAAAGNNNGWRWISNVNGASTDGTIVLQHSTDKFSTNFTNAFVGNTDGSVEIGGYLKNYAYTIATLPTCNASRLGSLATVNNGTAYATGTYGSAVSATGAVTRSVLCTNTGGATTYAWAYN